MKRDHVRRAVEGALAPPRFFLAAGELRLDHHARRTLRWEIFLGHLVAENQTRCEQTFESWELVWSGAPLVAVHFDPDAGLLYVTRSLLVYGWETYEDEPNVIMSREAQQWQRELVGQIDVARFAGPAELEHELASYVMLALVGTSRLPITSLESPLPAFSLGQLGYLPGLEDPRRVRSIAGPEELIEMSNSPTREPFARARLLETALRAAGFDQIATLAARFVSSAQAARRPPEDVAALCREVFNSVALTPYSGLVENLVALLEHLAKLGYLATEPLVDLYSYLLRHLVRHLTAFDLVQFHNLGANYPDALMLDALLKAYLAWIERHPRAFLTSQSVHSRRRRRALRQAWLVRQRYSGHRVPRLPTSPGENLRVLPAPFVRVSEDEIVQASKRSRQLFAAEDVEAPRGPNARAVLAQSMVDLDSPGELQELGMAVFLDRPLGIFKPPAAVDRTPLVSYEAFSREIARQRLADLARWGLLEPRSRERLEERLGKMSLAGVPVASLDADNLPGRVALQDAGKASPDFVFLRTTERSLRPFLAGFDLTALVERAPQVAAWLSSANHILLIRRSACDSPRGSLIALDAKMRPHVELAVNTSDGGMLAYVETGGIEYPRDGLRVLRLWTEWTRDENPPADEIAGGEICLPVMLAPGRRLVGRS